MDGECIARVSVSCLFLSFFEGGGGDGVGGFVERRVYVCM